MTDIETTLKERLADAETDVERLKAAIAVLEQPNGHKPVQARKTVQRSAQRARRSIKVTAEHVASHVTPSGVRSSHVAQTLSAPSSRVLSLLKELEANGAVKRSGTRRSTRWHRVTDNDRVATRAAEHAQTQAATKRKAAPAKAAANRKPKRAAAKAKQPATTKV